MKDASCKQLAGAGRTQERAQQTIGTFIRPARHAFVRGRRDLRSLRETVELGLGFALHE